MEKVTEDLTKNKHHDGKDKTHNHTREESRTHIREENKLFVPFAKISWASIFAGVVVTTVSQMLLSLLGMGIGMSTIDPLREQNPMDGLATGTIIWWSATMLISLFLGGWTTGRINKIVSETYLTWHGLLTWCTFTVFSFFMLTTSVGALISGTGNIIGTAVTASATANQNNPLDISSITRNVNGLLMEPTNNVTAQNSEMNASADNNVNNKTAMSNSTTVSGQNTSVNTRQVTGAQVGNNSYLAAEVGNFLQDKNVNNPEAKRELVKTVSAQTGMTEAEASRKVDQWKNSYDQLKAEARVKADETAKAISIGSIVGFFALIIGALVTILGARVAPITTTAVRHYHKN